MSRWIYISMIIIVFAARFATEKLTDTANTTVRFAMTTILMVLYTLFLEGFVYLMKDDPIIKDNLYQSIVVGIALINFAVLIVAICYYFVRKKRKMSDVDKMKLKDL